MVTEYQPEQNTFSDIVIDLTHRCNMECANCYIPNRDIPDLDISKLFTFLEKLPTRTYIRLIGAEPTMREDLPLIIQTVKKMGHRPSLTTNGVKLSNISYVELLKESGLRLILLSMNGADDNESYKKLDNGKWAPAKTKALSNIFKLRLPINTGTIIAKGLNEHILKRQVELFAELAVEQGINFNTDAPYKRITPVLRMKSIGDLGRNMGSAHTFSMDELISLASKSLGISVDVIKNNKTSAGVVRSNSESDALTSYMFPVNTIAGTVFVRLIDWSVDDEGVIDAKNPNRGRLTENWTIAPFFEHVKENEFGY